MWLRSVYGKSLRDYRLAILAWGIGMGLLVVSPMASVAALVTTPQARAQLATLAASFAWNAEPVAVDTVGGYATFKIGIVIFVLAVWPLLAASRMLRGEEERGSLDVLLAVPRPRLRVALEKLAALWTALAAIGVLIGLVTYAGGKSFQAAFGLGDALLFGLDLALIGTVMGGVALLLSQFTRERRPAAGAAAGLLGLFIVLDMVHRVMPNGEWVSRLSPIYYYNLSKPLVPSYGTNAVAMLVLLALAVLLSGAALWLFVHRDVGGTVPGPSWGRARPEATRPAVALPANDWSLRSVYARGLGMLVVPACWWTLVIAGFAGWMVVVVAQTQAQLATIFGSSPAFQTLLQNLGGSAGFSASFLSAMFLFVPVLLMAFAVTQVGGWAADEEEGRLELVLSTPQARPEVLLARFAALATATVVIGVVTLVVVVVAAAATGLRLDVGNVAAASLGTIPLALLIAAAGYLASGWLRAAADTGLLSFLLAIWFFISFIGPELTWPDAALRLSAFYYYGSPLLHGLALANVLGVLAVSLLALSGAAWRFARKDVGR